MRVVRLLRDSQPGRSPDGGRPDRLFSWEPILDVRDQGVGLLPDASRSETAHCQPNVFTLSNCHIVSGARFYSQCERTRQYLLVRKFLNMGCKGQNFTKHFTYAKIDRGKMKDRLKLYLE